MARILLLLIFIPVLYVAAVFAASEWGGEVVRVETQDGSGQSFVTSVWVVDMDGSAWLRAGNRDSGWVERLRTQPRVLVTRNGVKEAYRAGVRDEAVGRVNASMREKYGIADRIVSTLHDPGKIAAIRLVEP